MLHERDYVMRMIEQMGQALVRLRQMIFGGESVAEARDQIQAQARMVGMDLDLARLADPDTLRMLVSIGHELDPSRCWLLAEMLYLDGLTHEADDVDLTRSSYRTALTLLSLVEPGGGFLVGWPMASKRIDEISARLDDLDAGPDRGADSGSPVGVPRRSAQVRRSQRSGDSPSGSTGPRALAGTGV